MLNASALRAAPPEAVPGGRLGRPGTPQMIRWTEDWTAPPSEDASLLDRIRHIPIHGDSTYLSIGGEARYYYTHNTHTELGTLENDGNYGLAERFRLIADLHVGPAFRIFTEVGTDQEYGEKILTPPNESGPDLRQAFLDGRVPLDGAGSLTIRLGRFEMPLGSGKLVSIRDLNVRRLFNGVRATYTLPGILRVDGFDVRPVLLLDQPFDDGSVAGQSFRGIYATVFLKALKLPLSFDSYIYRFERDQARMHGVAGADKRNTYGVRLYGQSHGLDYDLELVGQSGTFADMGIRAWAVLSEGGYTLDEIPSTPRVFIRANAFSGDRSASDRMVNTFVAVSPKAPLFTGADVGWFTFSNVVDAFPGLTSNPIPQVELTLGPQFFWRQTSNDGLYTMGGFPLALHPSSSRFLGTSFNLEADWRVNRYLLLQLFATYLALSDAARSAGGMSASFVGFLVQFRF
ncbi:alginate export family protein [Pendulispora rubella]|uniref:Alginate export family protein n=1 Tax=Pendulispora rubella TaxID=2741070 RepID=A0ABZ2L7C8_9BACT